MPQPENMATTKDLEPKKPLTPAQEAALDRDGDGKAGGSLKAGQVLKRGAPPLTAADLGNDPDRLVLVRITGKGHRRVHSGTGARDRYDAGDEVALPLGVARSLMGDPNDRKARGYVEIIGKA